MKEWYKVIDFQKGRLRSTYNMIRKLTKANCSQEFKTEKQFEEESKPEGEYKRKRCRKM